MASGNKNTDSNSEAEPTREGGPDSTRNTDGDAKINNSSPTQPEEGAPRG